MQRFLRRFIAIHYCYTRAHRAVPKHAVLAVYGVELHSLYTICGVRRYFQHILGHGPCPGIKIRQPQPIICCIRSKREFLNVIRYYGLYCYVSKRFSVIYNGKIQANQFSRASRGRAVVFPGNVCRQQRKRAYAACSRRGFSYCFERYVHHRRGIFNSKLACRTFVPICKCSIKIRSRGQVGCVAYRIAERVGNIKRHILRILGYEHRIKLLAHNNMYLIAAALSAVEVYFAVHHVKRAVVIHVSVSCSRKRIRAVSGHGVVTKVCLAAYDLYACGRRVAIKAQLHLSRGKCWQGRKQYA